MGEPEKRIKQKYAIRKLAWKTLILIRNSLPICLEDLTALWIMQEVEAMLGENLKISFPASFCFLLPLHFPDGRRDGQRLSRLPLLLLLNRGTWTRRYPFVVMASASLWFIRCSFVRYGTLLLCPSFYRIIRSESKGSGMVMWPPR